jgi:ribokinase
VEGDIIVVGSANQDYVIATSALPAVGETLLAESLKRFPGGKGANQAVAAARLGADVRFIAAVGDDDDGALIIREMRAEGIDTSEIEIATNARTGLAIVSVLPNGENAITVIPGANYAVAANRIERAVGRLAGNNSVLLTQGEIPAACIEAAVRQAAGAGTRCIINLAPVVTVDPEVLALADPLVVNELEAASLTGYVADGQDGAVSTAKQLARRARSVVITLGALGACWVHGEEWGFIPALPVDHVVDTTGAGDAFVGALAVMIAEGADLDQAVRIAVEVGALAVTRLGAQASYPSRRDVRQLNLDATPS